MPIHVLLVDDDPADLRQLERDLPGAFKAAKIEAVIHPVPKFEDALVMAEDGSRRFDLILSDTFRGDQSKHDAAVIEMVAKYRKVRFCPLIVFSASATPPGLVLGPFVVWADKAEPKSIENAIAVMLSTGVPQIARALHEEIDRGAGSYLWGFLEEHWANLTTQGHVKGDALRRLVRRRAALQLADIVNENGSHTPIDGVHGVEFYVYPPLSNTQHSLGEVIQSKTDPLDFRVIMTPHCLLAVQHGKTAPRAEYVKTVRAVRVKDVIGVDKLATANAVVVEEAKHKKIRGWVTPPSRESLGTPEGRYWYLPALLEIPHLYCDFFRVESLKHDDVRAGFRSLAVLAPPYAESLQACYVAFHASVGIPNILPASVKGFFD